jgi:N-methylhydantoinase A/oxoprolinase/acetone carboxylase beta subunit
MPALELRLGIDVGATHTDAVVLDERDRMFAKAKVPSSPDIHAGIAATIDRLLTDGAVIRNGGAGAVTRVMLTTAAMTTAVEECSGLGRVAALRIGSPVGDAVPPLTDWPADLRRVVGGARARVRGGAEFDGRAIAPLDKDAVREFLAQVAGATHSVAISSIFSPVAPEQELVAAALVAEELGPAIRVSMSHQADGIGLLERENATILNAALSVAVRRFADGLLARLADAGLAAVEPFLARGDGTVMALEHALSFPVTMLGAGPAMALRGAAHLSGVAQGVVVDAGGRRIDVGVLHHGQPQASPLPSAIGGVRTAGRMPELQTLDVGGGSVVQIDQVPPAPAADNVGHEVTRRALVFGGDTPTLLDAAVAANRAQLGSVPLSGRRRSALTQALASVDVLLVDAVDRATGTLAAPPLVIVGGAGMLVPDVLAGASEVVRPSAGDVAGAVGTALAPIGGSVDIICPSRPDRHAAAMREARGAAIARAVHAGADPDRTQVVEVEQVPLSYLVDPPIHVRVAASGPCC